MPAYRLAGIRIPSALIAFLLPFVSGCADTRNSANSLNASIGSPCGTMGVMATTGVGTVSTAGYGFLRSTLECISAGPLYPLCVGAVTIASAATGLVYGLVDGIVHAPECREEDEAGVASDGGTAAQEQPANRPVPNVARPHPPAMPADRTVPPVRHTSPIDASIRAAFIAPIRCSNGYPAPACGI
jgi:hypothetical protein